MSLDTPIIRIAVLVAVLLASAAAMVALLVLNHSRSSQAKTATPSATTHHAATTAHPATKTPAVVHHAKPKPAAPRLLAGLPGPIAYALARHPVVVVELYEHGADDAAAVAEAQAGASLAHMPFLALDVLRPRFAAEVAGYTGTLAVPAAMVVRRPGVIVKRLDGYQDRQVVAQAASDGR